MKKVVLVILMIAMMISSIAMGAGAKPEDSETKGNEIQKPAEPKSEEKKEEIESKKEEIEIKKEEIESKKEEIEEKKAEIENKKTTIQEQSEERNETLKETQKKDKEQLKELQEALKKATAEKKAELNAEIQNLEVKIKNQISELVKLRNEIRAEIKKEYTAEELANLEKVMEEIKTRYEGIKLLDVDSIISKTANFKFDLPPVIKDGNTLIPVRAIAEGFKADIKYNEETKEVTIIKDGKVIVLTMGSNIAIVDGKEVKIDAEAEIINSRTVVPLRFIAETFGLTVAWNPEDETIEIAENETDTQGTTTEGAIQTTTEGAIETTTEASIKLEAK